MTLEELQVGAGSEFLFHYTGAIRADAIIEERCFVSGPRATRWFGIYATDIAPVGEETIDDVIVNCFHGDATPPEVNHTIAIRRSSGGLRFERTDDPYQWVLPTGTRSWCTSRGSTSPRWRSAVGKIIGQVG